MFLNGLLYSIALCDIFLHLLMGKGSFFHQYHVVLINVVLLLAYHGRQLGLNHREVVLGLIGSELDLVHEGIGLREHLSDTDGSVSVVLEREARVEGGLLVEVCVSAHLFLWKIIYSSIND